MTLLSAPVLAVALAAALAAHIWNRASSPLWHLPGPRASRLTSLVLRWHEFRAGRTAYIHALHLRHGPVVRVAPGEVSFSSYEAVKEIYGSQGSGYDKTAFYDLFRVFGRRTMFSTLNKTDVRSLSLCPFSTRYCACWMAPLLKQRTACQTQTSAGR